MILLLRQAQKYFIYFFVAPTKQNVVECMTNTRYGGYVGGGYRFQESRDDS
jgi:hypothetical protein